MEKKSPRVRHGGSDVKLGSDLGLERFQAQPKWEIPVCKLDQGFRKNKEQFEEEKIDDDCGGNL
jgi:hypothetical protein